ncbi:NnrS family protein [Phenylobacterium sp.]|uniref:NnrS family protein n=1 Tax=Phenylobacterium sp. TaxID=1871053 RepID=UPI00286DD737|nr:NnrS family protein [Phenylobacterium sp.]
MATAADRRAYRGPKLFSYGFRPFFLAAAIWAALAVPLWLLSFTGYLPWAALSREWHIHEMLFGVLGGIVAGFLLTAVPNWTGRLPVMGGPLVALSALWLAGRLAMLAATELGVWAIVIDSAFLVVFAGVVWREILAGRNWRNLAVCGLVTVLAGANIAFHLGALAPEGAGQRAALGAIALLIALIGGRVTPSFTRNWLMQRAPGPLPAPSDRADMAALILTGLAVAAWVAVPDVPLSGALLTVSGVAALARLARWQGLRTLIEPLVWILHLGYAWLGVGLMLIGLTILAPDIFPRTGGVHALTAGAVGVMTLAMMTRATLGHSGRPRTADGWTLVIYLLVNAAALVRVCAGFGGPGGTVLLAASGVLWSAAYGGFALAYGPMLLGWPSRPQGRALPA